MGVDYKSVLSHLVRHNYLKGQFGFFVETTIEGWTREKSEKFPELILIFPPMHSSRENM